MGAGRGRKCQLRGEGHLLPTVQTTEARAGASPTATLLPHTAFFVAHRGQRFSPETGKGRQNPKAD